MKKERGLFLSCPSARIFEVPEKISRRPVIIAVTNPALSTPTTGFLIFPVFYRVLEIDHFLHRLGIEAGIKLRKDAIVRLESLLVRYLAVVERETLGEDGWKARYEYWLR